MLSMRDVSVPNSNQISINTYATWNLPGVPNMETVIGKYSVLPLIRDSYGTSVTTTCQFLSAFGCKWSLRGTVSSGAPIDGDKFNGRSPDRTAGGLS